MTRPAWLVAAALEQLRAQLDELAPRRSRASDGAIGDAAHQSRSKASDHNPHWVLNGQAYVTARDFTHDPAGGLDCHRLAAALQRGRDQRVKYVIWNDQIMSGAAGPQPWTWRPYQPNNPARNRHTKHLHLSVVADARSLVRIPWALPQEDDDMPTAAEIAEAVWAHGVNNAWGGRVAAVQILAATEERTASAQAQIAALTAEGALARRGDIGYVRDQLCAALGVDPNALPNDIRPSAGGDPASAVLARIDELVLLLRAVPGVDPRALAAVVADELAARLRAPL